ncbi:hypothetical protein FGADI_7547 [Fusarium gaditjirri]|uniref:Uncharacterized protein n=1 Tax=Fusarium gaditjirri TaxID=282569 RepID=A0A8H4WVH5_9HYPO|nr:hypothetical protein FGADI_7547 [Fusarium gaditjirri]
MNFHPLFKVILVLGLMGCIVAAAAPDCSHPCTPGHQEEWICPIGIPKPRYHSGKWPTLEEEYFAKALIGPVSKQKSCGWEAEGSLCRAARNTHVTLSLVTLHPLTIKVKVGNYDTNPITFWTKYSPLSPHAFELGYLKITDGNQHVTGYAPQPEGYRPDTAPELSVISPGEALENDIVLTDQNHFLRQMMKTGGEVKVSMSGQWNGFWATTAPEVMKSDLGFACKNIWNSLGLSWSSKNELLVQFPQHHSASSYHHHSSHVSSDLPDETEATSKADSSESTTPKDDAGQKEGHAGEQPAAESPESVSPDDSSSKNVSQSDTEEIEATSAPSAAPQGRSEEKANAVAAAPSPKTMASTTLQPVRSACCKEGCKECKGS